MVLYVEVSILSCLPFAAAGLECDLYGSPVKVACTTSPVQESNLEFRRGTMASVSSRRGRGQRGRRCQGVSGRRPQSEAPHVICL